MNLERRLGDAFASTPREPAIARDDYLFPGPHVAAAVLIAVTDRPVPGVILTLRQATLRRHAGQIAFPGGRIDAEDESAAAAALREAREEVGLDPMLVRVIGAADRYRTGSGYDITPILGIVPPDLTLVPHEAEVADVFEVPLAFLLNRDNHITRTQPLDGRERRFDEIVWRDRRIWGITAALIVNLSRRLDAFA